MEARYVNPFTDFGFKKLFGEEASKPSLIDFLNSLLPQNAQIKNLSFKNSEQLGALSDERKAVFDIYCEGENGEKFIVELQKAKQDFFRERTIFYSTFPIAEQAKQGKDWNFNLTAVYCIGILDFTFSDYKDEVDRHQIKHEIKLRYPDGSTFYDKLTYIYLEMPNFSKSESELDTRLDKWLYFIKHLKEFQDIPVIFKNEVVFLSAFEKAEFAKYTPEEKYNYNQSLKNYWDLVNVMNSAVGKASRENFEKGLEKGLEKGIEIGRVEGIEIGKEKGIEEGVAKVARALKLKGVSPDLICETTGLTIEEIISL